MVLVDKHYMGTKTIIEKELITLHLLLHNRLIAAHTWSKCFSTRGHIDLLLTETIDTACHVLQTHGVKMYWQKLAERILFHQHSVNNFLQRKRKKYSISLHLNYFDYTRTINMESKYRNEISMNYCKNDNFILSMLFKI